MSLLRQDAVVAACVGVLLIAAAGCGDLLGSGATGRAPVVWRVELERRFAGSLEEPAADAERLYIPSKGVAAFSAATGERLWLYPLEWTIPRNVVVSDGRVFGAEAVAFALDAGTGTELWRFRPDGHGGFGTSAVDERAYYFGNDRHRVYALDRETGALRWSVDVGPNWEHFGYVAGISVSGDTLYAAVEQYNAANGYISTGWIIALDRFDGRELWRYRNGDGTDRRNISNAPTVAGRLLLASDLKGNHFFAVDRFTGMEVWRFTGPRDRFGPDYSPVAVGETAYVSSNDLHVYAMDVATGAIRWKRKLPASSGAFAVCRDRIFARWQGLSILDRHTGRVIYQSPAGADEFPTSGFAVHDDRAYVVSTHAAYAYRCR